MTSNSELLKALHILTRDGVMNSDSARKFKQVDHLVGFIEPVIQSLKKLDRDVHILDLGAGKSYLGFILYDLLFKDAPNLHLLAVESRNELIEKSKKIASQFNFDRMHFHPAKISDASAIPGFPSHIDLVLALHACDTATDDAIDFALTSSAENVVLVPCCQAEMADKLKSVSPQHPMRELWAHPIHRREFGSHVTNVLRSLKLESHGYKVRVTELVGWEHSMKNELIIGKMNENKSYIPEARTKWRKLTTDLGVTTRSTYTE